MEIKGSKVLILGGWGLVGAAIARKIAIYSPAEIIVTSLRQNEAEEAVDWFEAEFPDIEFKAAWGNLFARTEWKDVPISHLYGKSEYRKELIKDIFLDLDDDILKRSFLYYLVDKHKPDFVIDCINTATGIAYLDIYKSSNEVMKDLEEGNLRQDVVEQLVASSYVPQLIRHIQILSRSLQDAQTKMYLKVGTTGTGGMGMNIPYTHSEDRPSRVLMSKTAVAGAQTLLLYLLARTPDGPVYKEIKPAATIAWKRIVYGEIKKGGNPVELVDMEVTNAKDTSGNLRWDDLQGVIKSNDEILKSVFIDTGENGIFSKGEFEAISSIGQMELVTPEEIADYAVFEIRGGNTGRDVLQGLDAFSLGPTYRGGVLREAAMKKLNELEIEHNSESVAFELLGPPRLSKLLHEANLLKKVFGNYKNILQFSEIDISTKLEKLISEDKSKRSEILSIGLAILLPNGKYLRGENLKIPVKKAHQEIEINEENIEHWTYQGWIDLRPKNFALWKERIKNIMADIEKSSGDTSSRYVYNQDYWGNTENLSEGKIAAWIFEHEDKGWRFKR